MAHTRGPPLCPTTETAIASPPEGCLCCILSTPRLSRRYAVRNPEFRAAGESQSWNSSRGSSDGVSQVEPQTGARSVRAAKSCLEAGFCLKSCGKSRESAKRLGTFTDQWVLWASGGNKGPKEGLAQHRQRQNAQGCSLPRHTKYSRQKLELSQLLPEYKIDGLGMQNASLSLGREQGSLPLEARPVSELQPRTTAA